MLEALVQSPTTQYSSSSTSIVVVVVVFGDTDDGVSVEKSVTVFVVTTYIPTLLIVQVQKDIYRPGLDQRLVQEVEMIRRGLDDQ